MRYKTVGDAMTPLESVYMLNVTRNVDWNTMREVRGVWHLMCEGCDQRHTMVPIIMQCGTSL